MRRKPIEKSIAVAKPVTPPAAPPAAVTPMDLLQVAMSSGADLDRLEKLMDLQQKWEANQARKAYNEAMAAFRGENIQIFKDKLVDYQGNTGGRTTYRHATLGNIVEQITAALCRYGLSHSWRTAQSGEAITVTCRIAHVGGHFEENSLTASPDKSGSKNSIQAVASTVTYLERYTLKALLGIAEADNDGRRAAETVEDAVIYVSEEQCHNIEALIAETHADVAKFCRYMQVEGIDLIPAAKYQVAIKALEAKRSKA